jgi:hypothetical protein
MVTVIPSICITEDMLVLHIKIVVVFIFNEKGLVFLHAGIYCFERQRVQYSYEHTAFF